MSAPNSHPSTPADAASGPLARFPETVRAAHARFLANGDPAAVDEVVLAVLRDFLPRDRRPPEGQPLPDDARLIGDLGYDSLAVAETVFFLEDLYGVTVRNEEVMGLATVGDLRRFVRDKVASARRG